MVVLLVFIMATLENSFWPKKTVRRKKVHLAIMIKNPARYINTEITVLSWRLPLNSRKNWKKKNIFLEIRLVVSLWSYTSVPREVSIAQRSKRIRLGAVSYFSFEYGDREHVWGAGGEAARNEGRSQSLLRVANKERRTTARGLKRYL